FFFLNITQEFFITNKLYLFGFGALLLILISTLHFLFSKKLSWQKRPFDNLILLFLTAVSLSVLFSSPNKVQALLNPSFGLVMMVSLAILYFYLSRQHKGPSSSDEVGPYIKVLSVLSVFLSVLTIVFFFQPLKNIALPQNLAFLKNPEFTPVGSQLDLAIFLGFFVVIAVVNLLKKGLINQTPTKKLILNSSFLILNLLALSLTVYSLIKVQTGHAPSLQLPPFRLSWFAALEILKNPQTALVGVGLDNFSSIFTRVKDLAYNQSSLWQINAFTVSRSAILQILTETGIFGLFAFGLLIFNVFKSLVKGDHKGSPLQIICLFVYLIICLFVFPPSLIIWFLFFVMLAQLSRTDGVDHVSGGTGIARNAPTEIDLKNLAPIYLGTAVVSFLLIAGAGYFLGRSYVSEYYFKQSINGISENNLKKVYDSQKQAIILNPYIERFRSSFAQTNLLVANNLAQKDPKKITEQDRQTITQAIQAGIAEGKAVVSLNPQRADGWQNLAAIYLNIIGAAKGADVWTISAYQRAILADPQNPIYRVGLGGVYYSLTKYDDALKFFEQAVSLKPDWPNANYNYAWANFQKENYPQAVNAMQNVLNLLDPKLNKADYEKAQKELEEFKLKLPEEKTAAEDGETKPGTLNLPSPPATLISPKIELPKDASPEAK
ncbi:MAG: tetratricopeptide repeat protein, partial [Patescibacteria group bacterium]